MTHPLPPTPQPGGDLTEVIRRLDMIERKLDWVARRVVMPSGTAAPAESAPVPQPARPAARAVPSTTAAPAQPDLPAAVPPATQAPAAAPAQAPAAQPLPPHPAPTARPVLPAPALPAAQAAQAALPVPQPRPTAPARPSAWERARREGNIGRYVLSGAAALLIVLAAVSLLALVWDSIPDVVKVAALGALALALTGTGTWMSGARPRLRVAAATLTGTGGALGFVAVIGATTLGLVPHTAVSLLLMAAWGVVLLLVSRRTNQVFTAVVSTVGAWVTLGYASAHAWGNPEAAVPTWGLVLVYLLALAGTTTYLSHTSANATHRVLYPATSLSATLLACLLTPFTPLLGSGLLLASALTLLPVVLLHAQLLHASPLLAARTGGFSAGAEWCVAAVVLLVDVLSLDLTGSFPGGADYLLLLTPLAVTVASVLLASRVPAPPGWFDKGLTGHLVQTVLVSGTVAVLRPELAVLSALALLLPVLLSARRGNAGAVTTLATTGLLSGVLFPLSETVAERSGPLATLVVVLTGTVVAERALPPLEGAGPRGDRRTLQRGTAWVTAATTVLLLPHAVASLLSTAVTLPPGTSSTLEAVLASVLLGTVVHLGLLVPGATVTDLLSGRLWLTDPDVGKDGQPLTPRVGGQAAGAATLLALGGAADLLGALTLETWQQAVLVVTGLALTALAVRRLAPWVRTVGGGLACGLIPTASLLWSLLVLTDFHPVGAVVSGLILLLGAVCILLGFRLRATVMRHYGLGLVLLAVLKLAVLDVSVQSAVLRVAVLAGAGVVCFLLSLAYNKAADSTRDHTTAPGLPPQPGQVPGQPVPAGAAPLPQPVPQPQAPAPLGYGQPAQAPGHPGAGGAPQGQAWAWQPPSGPRPGSPWQPPTGQPPTGQ